MRHLLISLVMSVCLVVGISVSDAHLATEILHCTMFQPLHPHGTPEIIDTRLSQNGLFSELYDINGDGRPDLAVYSPTYGMAERQGDEDLEVIHGVPILYEIDYAPQDGAPDLIYIDVTGEQNCQGLMLYYNLSAPDARNIEKRPKGAMIGWDGAELFQHTR